MSAIDKKHLIEILSLHVERKSDEASGRTWEVLRAECIVSGLEEVDQQANLYLPMSFRDTPPGKYYVEWGLRRTFDRNFVPGVIQLHKPDDVSELD